MARKKRNSPAVARASVRSAALKSIDPNLDLGNGLTLTAYDKAISDTDDLLTNYNLKLSEVDGALNELQKGETDLDEMSSRMLAGAGVKYGKDSSEYEQAGGTRSSERKAAVRGNGKAATDSAKA